MKSGRVIRTFVACDGQKVVLRTPGWKDLGDLTEMINSLVEEKADTTMTKKVSREREMNWLAEVLVNVKKGNALYVVAEVAGKAVANSEISRKDRCRGHVGVIGIAIRSGFRDIRIGTEIMNVLIDQGRKWGLKVLTLSVFASNKRAFHVYEKVGSVQTGSIPKGIFKEGKHLDEILMTKLLE